MDKRTKDAQRRERIRRLIDEQCGGVIAEFARRIKRDVSYVGRMLYPMGKAGKRGISVHTIDAIEAEFKLPHGWLDGIEPPDEYLAEIMRLWPKLAEYKRRALATMARELSADHEGRRESSEPEEENNPPKNRRQLRERRKAPRNDPPRRQSDRASPLILL